GSSGSGSRARRSDHSRWRSARAAQACWPGRRSEGGRIMRPAHAPNDGGAFEASADGAIRSGPEPSFELMLASGPAAPAAARAAMRAWMGRAPTDALLIDALMVIGELVANSVRQ